jgi:hypothetical protein
MIQLPGTIEFHHGGTSLALGQRATSYAQEGLRLLSDTGTRRQSAGQVVYSRPTPRTRGAAVDIGIGIANTLLDMDGPMLIRRARRAEERGFSRLAQRVCRLAGRPGH